MNAFQAGCDAIMTVRRILILTPLLLTVILLQSYFWVPAHEQQTRGNPGRLTEFINGSIGDATSLLNPVLSSDTASSEIESMVFEGLIDRSEDLRFRGRPASSWRISEEAYFYVNPAVAVAGLDPSNPRQTAGFLRDALERKAVAHSEFTDIPCHVREISVIPAKVFKVYRTVKISGESEKETEIEITVSAPARIKMVLDQVDQDLFDRLDAVLGGDYFKGFHAEDYLHTVPGLTGEQLAGLAAGLLPAVEHNPVIEFSLRPGVKFHDGHIVDAYDVRFTYEAIMDPASLSPRPADYEPVKAVEVVDPQTVRVVYKRLYSPAGGTWAMGILPAHLLNAGALKKEAVLLGEEPGCLFDA